MSGCDHVGVGVVAICGSMRMWPQMLEVAATLAKQGSVALLPTPYPDGDRALLARLHEHRIDLADSVLVVGAPGEATRCEVAYALSRVKPVDYTRTFADEPPCPHTEQVRDSGDGEDTVMRCTACGELVPVWT